MKKKSRKDEEKEQKKKKKKKKEKTQKQKECLTILKHSFNIQSVRGTSFKVCTALELGGKQARPCILDDPRVHLTDHVLRADKYQRDFTQPGTVLRHLWVVRVDGVEAHFTLEAERQDDGIHPVRKLTI